VGIGDSVPDFNTTLKRRTLEDDDIAALNFLYRNSFIPDEFTKPSSALSLTSSTSNDTIIVWGGTYTETEHLTVNTTNTMITDSNATIKMSSGKKLYVYGKLDATSTMFTSDCTYANAWGGIYLSSGASVASTINDCEIKFPYYGVYLHNFQSHAIQNTDIDTCVYGIFGDAGGAASITNVDITGCTYAGIKLTTSTSPDISDTKITETSYVGLQCESGSSPDVWDCEFTDNTTNGLYCYNNGNPDFISAYEKLGTKIYDNDLDEVYCNGADPVL